MYLDERGCLGAAHTRYVIARDGKTGRDVVLLFAMSSVGWVDEGGKRMREEGEMKCLLKWGLNVGLKDGPVTCDLVLGFRG